MDFLDLLEELWDFVVGGFEGGGDVSSMDDSTPPPPKP
jgi:hypothetical protein